MTGLGESQTLWKKAICKLSWPRMSEEIHVVEGRVGLSQRTLIDVAISYATDVRLKIQFYII